jgi:Leucine-rich repeat (LRR) protein
MQSPLLAQLTELNLSGNDLTTRGVRQLVEQIEEWKGEGVSVNDRSLDLSRNRLGLAGQQALRGLRPMVWID